MKALVYDGPREVVVKDVPDAKIEHPTDALVKITTTNICGSDLHMYEGRTDLDPGMVLGTRIWASSPRSAARWSSYRQEIGCVCPSTSVAVSAVTVKRV